MILWRIGIGAEGMHGLFINRIGCDTESASFSLTSLIEPAYQKCSGHILLLVILVTARTVASHSFPQFLQLVMSFHPDLWGCA